MEAKQALAKFIRFVMRDTTYHVTYDAVVQQQHDDDSVDLLPDDKRVRGTGLARVPLRHGLPGVRVRVKVGSRVLLGFVNANPRVPYAGLWEPGSIEEIRFDDGQSPIARVGDPVAIYWPAGMSIVGTIPAGALTGTIVVASQSAGIIESGAPGVLA